MAFLNESGYRPDYKRPPNVKFHWEGFVGYSYTMAQCGWKFEGYRSERTFAHILAVCSPRGDAYGRVQVDDRLIEEYLYSSHPVDISLNLVMGKDVHINEYNASPNVGIKFTELDASPDAAMSIRQWHFSRFIFPVKERIATFEEPKLIIPNETTIAEVMEVLQGRQSATNRAYFEQQLREEKARPIVRASIVSLEEYRKAA